MRGEDRRGKGPTGLQPPTAPARTRALDPGTALSPTTRPEGALNPVAARPRPLASVATAGVQAGAAPAGAPSQPG
jgi:hypothetical protein